MDSKAIDARLVYGFLEADKATYVQDGILNDFFHKYGSTLTLIITFLLRSRLQHSVLPHSHSTQPLHGIRPSG